jgi:hypothetical protein
MVGGGVNKTEWERGVGRCSSNSLMHPSASGPSLGDQAVEPTLLVCHTTDDSSDKTESLAACVGFNAIALKVFGILTNSA